MTILFLNYSIKKHVVVVAVDNAIKLAHVLFIIRIGWGSLNYSNYKQKKWPLLSCAVLFLEFLLEGYGWPLPKHLLFGWWSSSVQLLQSSEGGCS